jgi:predicted hydrocarbon binding protein
MTTSFSHTATEELSAHLLQKIFGEHAQVFDMTAGTVLSNTDVRVIYLSTDVIQAIYDVLKYETGDAWSLILKSCGVVWGKRVSASLETELQLSTGQGIGQLSVADYIAVLEAYFANHGWGKMRFHLDDAENHGIVRAALHNSLFAHTLKQLNAPVDFMISGMLQGIFSAISEQNLHCTQVAYLHTGSDYSEFLISAATRIERLEQEKLHDLNLNDALAYLRTAR